MENKGREGDVSWEETPPHRKQDANRPRRHHLYRAGRRHRRVGEIGGVRPRLRRGPFGFGVAAGFFARFLQWCEDFAKGADGQRRRCASDCEADCFLLWQSEAADAERRSAQAATVRQYGSDTARLTQTPLAQGKPLCTLPPPQPAGGGQATPCINRHRQRLYPYDASPCLQCRRWSCRPTKPPSATVGACHLSNARSGSRNFGRPPRNQRPDCVVQGASYLLAGGVARTASAGQYRGGPQPRIP